jgi:hypothetical protein
VITDIQRISSQAQAVVPTGEGGAGLSDAIDFRPYAGGGFITPATLDATTVIGFQVSADGVTFLPLCDKDNALVKVTVTLDAAKAYPLPDELYGWSHFKLFCMTTAGAAVNQTGAKTFTLHLKG